MTAPGGNRVQRRWSGPGCGLRAEGLSSQPPHRPPGATRWAGPRGGRDHVVGGATRWAEPRDGPATWGGTTRWGGAPSGRGHVMGPHGGRGLTVGGALRDAGRRRGPIRRLYLEK